MESKPPPLKWAQPPVFGSCLLCPNGWMNEDTAWYSSRPWPMPHCVRRGPSSLSERGTAVPPSFGPCLLWSRCCYFITCRLQLLVLSLCTLFDMPRFMRCVFIFWFGLLPYFFTHLFIFIAVYSLDFRFLLESVADRAMVALCNRAMVALCNRAVLFLSLPRSEGWPM